jgi:hypothetical protein
LVKVFAVAVALVEKAKLVVSVPDDSPPPNNIIVLAAKLDALSFIFIFILLMYEPALSLVENLISKSV